MDAGLREQLRWTITYKNVIPKALQLAALDPEVVLTNTWSMLTLAPMSLIPPQDLRRDSTTTQYLKERKERLDLDHGTYPYVTPPIL